MVHRDISRPSKNHAGLVERLVPAGIFSGFDLEMGGPDDSQVAALARTLYIDLELRAFFWHDIAEVARESDDIVRLGNEPTFR